MTLIYEPDLEIVNVYLHTKKISMFSKVRPLHRDTQRDTQTDATKRITARHLRVVNDTSCVYFSE